jgi:hypothetical protein
LFANPIAPPRVLPPQDILRFLRLITSPACRGEKRIPISAIAAMCGVARITLYEVLWTGRASYELCAVLTPLVRAHEAGKLKFKGSGRPGARGGSSWEIVES